MAHFATWCNSSFVCPKRPVALLSDCNVVDTEKMKRIHGFPSFVTVILIGLSHIVVAVPITGRLYWIQEDDSLHLPQTLVFDSVRLSPRIAFWSP